MCQYVPDVNFSPVVVDRGDDPGLVPRDVKHGEFPHFVGMGEDGSDFLNVAKPPPAHFPEPLHQAGFAVGVTFREVIQSLSCDDMHDPDAVMWPRGWKWCF